MPKKAFVHFFTLTFGLGANPFKSDGKGGVKIMQRKKFSFLKPSSVLLLSKWKVFNSIVCHFKINLSRKSDAETTSFVFLQNQRRGFRIVACCLKCLCDRGLTKSPNSLLFLKDTIFVLNKIIPGIILSTWLEETTLLSCWFNPNIKVFLQCLYIICRYKGNFFKECTLQY